MLNFSFNSAQKMSILQTQLHKNSNMVYMVLNFSCENKKNDTNIIMQ